MILQALSEAVGVSGKEDAVRKIVLDAIKDHATDIRIDPLGSVTARKASASGERPLRVLVAAHMDEVGLMVQGADSDGLLRFVNIGGVDERILPGLRLKVGDNLIPGVVIWTPIHKNRDQTVIKMSNLRIDIGATSKDDALGKVKIGDCIAFDSRYLEVGEKMLRGKAFDDRAGCSLLIDALQAGSYTVELLAGFTVQEEIGLRGATVVAQALNPDVAIVLEATTAQDLPNPTAPADHDEPPNPVCRVGAGPVLTVMDGSMIVPPRLQAFLRRTAEANGIPYQIKTRASGGTDGGAIHRANAGVPTMIISLPCRYIHSPAAYLHRDDYANALRLLQAALNNLTPDVLL